MSLVPFAHTNLDEYEDDDNLRGSQKSTQSPNKMFFIGRQLCFLLLIALTTFASFNSSINSGSGPPAVPFFPRGSPVSDFFKGELSEALLHASEGDISFVMYYAPWDAESQSARRHFEALALIHYKEVYFAGINCWQPRGECRRTLSKITQFPKFVAYLTHETGIEYNGPRDVQYMSNFIQGVMRPLNRLHNLADLVRLRSTYNAVVVAYLNFYGVRGGPSFRAMYEAAHKFLEREPKQEVAFAVVTSFKTAMEMGVDHTPCIKLYLWNETLVYSGDFVSSHLVEWIFSRLLQVTLWLSPPGVKSFTLAPYVTQKPVLIMFTQYNNFVMYDLLREVGLEYHNCNNSSYVSDLAQNISTHVSERISQARRAMLTCQSHSHGLAPTIQIINNVWSNSSCGRRISRNSQSLASVCDRQATKNFQHKSKLTSKVTPESDALAAPALTEWMRRETCRLSVPPPPRLPNTPLPLSVRGLACRLNRSVSLLALDSSLSSHFARGLGVDLSTKPGKTRVILLNSQMETTHVLEEPVTRDSLAQFLVNFTEGRLERFQRSAPFSVPSESLPSTATVSVTELSTDTFLPVAFNDSMNVVVFYYTPYCAFCHSVNHVYLSATRLLRDVPTLLFTRIDGENNDLPWQYTAPHYPSILFFPANRKAESRVFATKVAITVESLTQFVLANLPVELRLLGMIQVCQQQSPSQQRECLIQVRKEVLEAIGSRLSRYRALSRHMPASSEKRHVLGRELVRLQVLKRLQLHLSGDSARLAKGSHWLTQLGQSQEFKRLSLDGIPPKDEL